jgi:hypothetical protein
VKIKTLAIIFLPVLLFLAACAGSATPSPPPDVGEPLPSKISLKVGEEFTLDKAQITLILNAVTEDSRCPATVRCVHAGWVTVDISMKENGETTGNFFWTLPQDYEGQPSEVTVDNITIRLLEVNPYPVDPGPISQEDYEVVLEVIE